MNIKYKKVNSSLLAFAPQKRDIDADYDLFTPYDISIYPNEIVSIRTNISISFPDGWEGKIEDKSGLALRGLHVLGGVIDNSYIGEIIVILVNLSDDKIHFETGKKIAQLKIREQSHHFVFVETQEDFAQTDRGTSGFGSTGA